jgi:hypothetical protein
MDVAHTQVVGKEVWVGWGESPNLLEALREKGEQMEGAT